MGVFVALRICLLSQSGCLDSSGKLYDDSCSDGRLGALTLFTGWGAMGACFGAGGLVW